MPFDRPIFWIGVTGLILTGLITVWFGPRSHANTEDQVESAASAALAAGGHDWATAKAYGQRVALSGQAPDEQSLQEASNAVMAALGSGGVLRGGVTKVTSRGVDVVPMVSSFAWGAIREGRQITLEGVAPDRQSLDAIETAARDLFGASNVISRMSLAGGAPAQVDWSMAATESLAALNKLDRGSAELTNNRLVLTGQTASEETAQSVQTSLEALNAGVTITTFISGPAEWTASLGNGELDFSGTVADEETRGALAEIARSAFDEQFADTSRVGAAGAWGPRIRLALPHFARFQSGQISVLDDRIRISGRAPASAITFLREDMSGLRDDYEVLYSIEEASADVAELADIDLDATDPGELQASCQQGFTQVMASNQILFESGSSRIDRVSGETLDKLISVMRRCATLRIEVQGHTDATGRGADNKELSTQRANAVRTYFIEAGIEPDQLSAMGYGEERPVASNRTAEGRQQNRRIEFSVSSAEDAQ